MSGNASNPAQGGFARNEADFSAMSKQYSSRDMPSHTRLKYRQPGQTNQDEVRQRDLRAELDEAELSWKREHSADSPAAKKPKPSALTSTSYMPALPPSHDLAKLSALDADDPVDRDSSDEDEDDEADLYAELERLKRERMADEMRSKIQKKAEEERTRKQNLLRGNPIFNQSEFSVDRRWNDDAVFKNCARSTSGRPKTFINDSLRSRFHRRFMEKYIR